MMKKKKQESNQVSEKIDNLSDKAVQKDDRLNIDDCSVSDQEILDDENDSFQIINSNYTTQKSYSSRTKRLSSFSSTSDSRKKKKNS